MSRGYTLNLKGGGGDSFKFSLSNNGKQIYKNLSEELFGEPPKIEPYGGFNRIIKSIYFWGPIIFICVILFLVFLFFKKPQDNTKNSKDALEINPKNGSIKISSETEYYEPTTTPDIKTNTPVISKPN